VRKKDVDLQAQRDGMAFTLCRSDLNQTALLVLVML